MAFLLYSIDVILQQRYMIDGKNVPSNELDINGLVSALAEEEQVFWEQNTNLPDSMPEPFIGREKSALAQAEATWAHVNAAAGNPPNHQEMRSIFSAKANLLQAKRALRAKTANTSGAVTVAITAAKKRTQELSLDSAVVVNERKNTVSECFSQACELSNALKQAMSGTDIDEIKIASRALELSVHNFNMEQINSVAGQEYAAEGLLNPARSVAPQLKNLNAPAIPGEINPFSKTAVFSTRDLENRGTAIQANAGVVLKACYGIWQLDAQALILGAVTRCSELDALAIAESESGRTHERVRRVTTRERA